MDIHPDFRELLRNLNRHGVEYVIVGAYALAFHGVPRATKDIDLLLHANPDNADRILAALSDFGFDAMNWTREDFIHPRFTFRLGRPPQQIDLLTTMTGVSWEEVWAGRVTGEYGGVPVHVIGREAFIKAKRAAGRLRDLADIESLEQS